MSWSRRISQLSPGARARLQEYAEEFESRIIAEAERLNPNDVLNARDISDAYEVVQARSTDDAASLEYLTDSSARVSRLIQVYAITAASFGIISGVLLMFLRPTAGGAVLSVFAPFAAFMAGALALGVVALTVIDGRRRRMVALQMAEHRRDSELAVFVADTIQSSAKSPHAQNALQIGRFISQWARLEDRLRRLAVVALGMDPNAADGFPIGGLLRRLTDAGVLVDRVAGNIEDILGVRNKLAHGRDTSKAEVQVGLDMMESLETFLDEYIGRHMTSGL